MGKVIFVNGTARCGSTMVDLILGNDPAGFSLGEVCSWYRPTRTHHFDIKCGCGVYPCPVWEELRRVPREELYDRIQTDVGVDYVVDSSKRMTWVVDQYLALRQRGRNRVLNVFLYKDPVSLHYSRWKRGSRAHRDTAVQYRYYEHALRSGLPFVTVNYDWMIQDIGSALHRLCEILEIPYREGKERFWEKEHHQLWGSFGPRRQLHSRNAHVYREAFSDEYRAQIGQHKAIFDQDDGLHRILGELRRRDVREVDAYPEDGGAGVHRTLTYYRHRWKEFRGRFFPEHWIDSEAATIQEWRVR